MKMIKGSRLLPLLALFAVIVSLNSCSKSNDAPPVEHTITGLWVGSTSNSTGGEFYSLSIKPDGKITFEAIISDKEQFGSGTWTLTGSDFSAHVTTLYGVSTNIGVQQLLTAKFSSTNGQLTDGHYQNTSPANDSGNFTLTKVE